MVSNGQPPHQASGTLELPCQAEFLSHNSPGSLLPAPPLELMGMASHATVTVGTGFALEVAARNISATKDVSMLRRDDPHPRQRLARPPPLSPREEGQPVVSGLLCGLTPPQTTGASWDEMEDTVGSVSMRSSYSTVQGLSDSPKTQKARRRLDAAWSAEDTLCLVQPRRTTSVCRMLL